MNGYRKSLLLINTTLLIIGIRHPILRFPEKKMSNVEFTKYLLRSVISKVIKETINKLLGPSHHATRRKMLVPRLHHQFLLSASSKAQISAFCIYRKKNLWGFCETTFSMCAGIYMYTSLNISQRNKINLLRSCDSHQAAWKGIHMALITTSRRNNINYPISRCSFSLSFTPSNKYCSSSISSLRYTSYQQNIRDSTEHMVK